MASPTTLQRRPGPLSRATKTSVLYGTAVQKFSPSFLCLDTKVYKRHQLCYESHCLLPLCSFHHALSSFHRSIFPHRPFHGLHTLRPPRQLSTAPSPLPSTHSHLISSWHSGPLPSHLSSWLSPPFSIIPSKILVYLLNPNTSSFASASTWLPSADSPEHPSGKDLSTAVHERLQHLPPHPRWALPALALPPAA